MKTFFLLGLLVGLISSCATSNKRDVAGVEDDDEEKSERQYKRRGMDGIGFSRSLR